MSARRYTPTSSLLAIDAASIGLVFDPPPPPAVEMRDGVAIVPIRGVMNSHEGPGACDNYDSIRRRVEQAIAGKPVALVLAIDSPGGMVAGCMELADDISRMCAEASLPIESYVDGQATSAAYAIACAGSKITVPPTGIVGSIGTITELVDATAIDAAMGLKFHIVASGERKTDRNPHTKVTDVAVKVVAGHINEMAESLFEFVAARRPITVERVRGLEAGMLIGANAARAGLADNVGTLSSLVARLSGKVPAVRASDGSNTNEASMTEDEKARAALKAIVDDEKSDEKAKARAAAALKAMDGDEEEPKKEDDKAKAASDDKGAGDPPKKDEESDGAKALALAKQTNAMLIEDRRVRAVGEMLAGRPDLTPEQRAAFSKLEPKALSDILAVTPRGVVKPTASLQVSPTLGKGQGDTEASADPQVAAMDRVMGFAPKVPAVRRDGVGMVFGALSHEEAREIAQKGVVR